MGCDNRVWFVEPTAHHNNFGIMAEGDEEFIQKVNNMLRRDCTCNFLNDPQYDEKKTWGAFHQGNSPGWTYWEFWHELTTEFREKVLNKIVDLKMSLTD